jgi:hypothetical protein
MTPESVRQSVLVQVGERCERTVLADSCEPLLERPTGPADEGERLEDLNGL